MNLWCRGIKMWWEGGVSTGVLGECFLVEEISKFSASWGNSPPASPLVGKTLREMLLSTKKLLFILLLIGMVFVIMSKIFHIAVLLLLLPNFENELILMFIFPSIMFLIKPPLSLFSCLLPILIASFVCTNRINLHCRQLSSERLVIFFYQSFHSPRSTLIR